MPNKLQQWLRVEKNQSVLTLSAVNLFVFLSSMNAAARTPLLLLVLQVLSIASCYAVTTLSHFDAYEKPASRFWHSFSIQFRSALLLVLAVLGYRFVLARLLAP
jgi:hypothetical protein